VLCFHQLYDTECPAVDVLNNKTLFYTYRYSIVVSDIMKLEFLFYERMINFSNQTK